MADSVQMVIEQFQRILRTDGGSLELLGVEGDVVSLRYAPGHNDDCESCVLSAEDMRELVKEALQQHMPSLQDVNLVVAQPAAGS